MEKTLEKRGKTVDEALNAALAELGIDRDSLAYGYEILEMPKSGFLGIGASPAVIRVTYQVADPEPAPAPEKPAEPAKPARAEKPTPNRKNRSRTSPPSRRRPPRPSPSPSRSRNPRQSPPPLPRLRMKIPSTRRSAAS